MNTQHALNEQEAEEERIDDELAPLSDEAAFRRRVTRQINKRNEFRTHLVTYVVVVALLTALFVAIGIPWVAGMIALAWGSGLAAHGVDTYYYTGKRAALRTARVHQAFRDEYGPRWYDTANHAQLRRTLKRVEEPYNKRREFLSHLVVFVGINAMLWWIYLAVMAGGFPWPLFITGFWGLGLVMHGLSASTENRSQRNIEREVERQRELLGAAAWGDEKAKNDFVFDDDDAPTMSVGPDGELVELTDEEWDEQQKRKRG